MGVSKWSKTAAENNVILNDGMPENMDRSDVNDQSRAQMASLRTFFEDGEWLNLLDEPTSGDDWFGGQITLNKFRIRGDGAGTLAAPKFVVGRWVRITSSASPTKCIARITASSTVSTDIWEVTVDPILNAEAIPPTLAEESSLPVDAEFTLIECYWNTLVGEAAFHPVGKTVSQTPTQLLSIDDLGTEEATTQINTVSGDSTVGTGVDADLLEGNAASAFSLVATPASQNAVMNGSMNIWQRGTTFDGVDLDYTADTWLHREESAGWEVDRSTVESPDSSFYSMRLKGTSSGPKVAAIHILTAADSAAIIGAGKASLSFEAFLPAAGTVGNARGAILEWTGTADSVDKDVISATWGADGVDPTLVTNFAYAGTPVAVTATDAWTRGELENVTISAATKNLAVMIYTNDKSFNINDFFYIGAVRLQAGPRASVYIPSSFSTDMAACRTRFVTTYDYGVAPGTAASYGGMLMNEFNKASDAATGEAIWGWNFGTVMFRGSRLPTVTPYSPHTGLPDLAMEFASGGFEEDDECLTTIYSLDTISTTGCFFIETGNPLAGRLVACQATASSEPTDAV